MSLRVRPRLQRRRFVGGVTSDEHSQRLDDPHIYFYFIADRVPYPDADFDSSSSSNNTNNNENSSNEKDNKERMYHLAHPEVYNLLFIIGLKFFAPVLLVIGLFIIMLVVVWIAIACEYIVDALKAILGRVKRAKEESWDAERRGREMFDLAGLG
jgi:hypothetical protein